MEAWSPTSPLPGPTSLPIRSAGVLPVVSTAPSGPPEIRAAPWRALLPPAAAGGSMDLRMSSAAVDTAAATLASGDSGCVSTTARCGVDTAAAAAADVACSVAAAGATTGVDRCPESDCVRGGEGACASAAGTAGSAGVESRCTRGGDCRGLVGRMLVVGSVGVVGRNRVTAISSPSKSSSSPMSWLGGRVRGAGDGAMAGRPGASKRTGGGLTAALTGFPPEEPAARTARGGSAGVDVSVTPDLPVRAAADTGGLGGVPRSGGAVGRDGASQSPGARDATTDAGTTVSTSSARSRWISRRLDSCA